MSEFAIEVEGGKAVRLKTAGKYCDRNIVVTATGGGGDTDAAYQQGVVDGKQAEYDRFWDAYQQNGERTMYEAAFFGQGWTDETFKPKYKISTTSAHNMFAYSQITAPLTADMVDFSKATNAYTAFRGAQFKEMELLDFSSNNQVYSYTFDGAAVEKIGLLILSDISTAKTNMTTFQKMSKLTHIRIQGTLIERFTFAASPLDKESIISVMSALSDTTTGISAGFKKSAVNTAFETSEGAADGSASEEWLALVATKPNWTISLA